jgi:hypothetical protein
MHDVSTRASQTRRQRQKAHIPALAAVLLAASTPSVVAAARIESGETTGTIERRAAHEVRISFTGKGREGIELAARLAEGGGLIQRPILWLVRNAAGERVFEGEVPQADFLAAPGDYDITARYGTVTVRRALTLLPEQRVGVTFTLDVGGIRVLPRVGGIGLPALEAQTAIYAASGPEAGRRVAVSLVPGEVIRVGAGTYRVETLFRPGNTVMSARVTVRPGIMSAIEVDHIAGIARLSAGQTVTGDPSWLITNEHGEALPPIKGAVAEVVLKPGDYVAEMTNNGTVKRVKFTMVAGEQRTITPAP